MAGAPALVVKDGYVVTGDDAGRAWPRADVVVRDGRIAALGPGAADALAPGEPAEVIDARGAIVLPGLINAHIHSNEGFEQGLFDNLPLELWLLKSYSPFGFPMLSAREYYLRTMLVAIESIRSGVTTVQDDYVHPPATREAMDAALQAYADSGLRAWVAADLWNLPMFESLPYLGDMVDGALRRDIEALPMASGEAQLALFQAHFDKWHGHDGRIRVIIAPCGPQRCSVDLLKEVNRLSQALGVPVHSHTLETKLQVVQARDAWGKSVIEFLDEIGLLTPRLTLVHAIWLTDDDIRRLGDAGCAVVHNPLSNLKLGSGVAPIRRLLDAKVAVGLGTDGLATSDTADLIEALRVASLIHKTGTAAFEEWVSAEEVFAMATRGGARTGLMADEVGSLAPGKRADIILLDRDHWGFVPLSAPIRQLAFSVTSEAVTTSIIEGRVVMRNRRILTLDEAALRDEIRAAGERFRTEHVPAMAAGAARLEPHMRAMYARAAAQTVTLGEAPRRLAPSQAR